LIEIEDVFGEKQVESEKYFGLNCSEDSNNENFSLVESERKRRTAMKTEADDKTEKEDIVSQLDEIGELLKLSGGSSDRSDCNFSRGKSEDVIEIEESVEIVRMSDFKGSHSLKRVIFSSDSHLREISGFQFCTSLCRIEIPSSVEWIGLNGFLGCTSLNEIVFSSDSHLREIDGFQGCTSLCRIDIPSSVEKIGWYGFLGCTSLRLVNIRTGCRMGNNEGLRNLRPFLVHEDDDLKNGRCLVHLGNGRR
jgi:hypothetical protein